MRANPDERDERMPREAYPPCTVELGGQPVAGPLVERAGLVNRVEQDVRVDEHYRASAPSRCSSASATLLTSIRRPRFAVRCRKAERRARGASPAPISPLTASLHPTGPSSLRRRTTARTSYSRERGVGAVKGVMMAGGGGGQGRTESSFRALEAGGARRTGLPEPTDPQFLADLRVLHASFLAVPELSFMGLAGILAELGRHLRNRLRVRELLRANPQITSAPVPRPVFVVGLPRTGTTVLHALLASAPGHRAPLLWELLDPCPQPGPGGSDRRVRDAERLAWLAHRAAPSLPVIHPLDAGAPQECLFALPHHLAYFTRARIPDYPHWYTSRDAT